MEGYTTRQNARAETPEQSGNRQRANGRSAAMPDFTPHPNAIEAVVHLPGEGERHPAGDSEIVIKATGAETDGTFFLSETTIAPGFPGPPAHRHERLVDMFYVLEGALSVRLGDQIRQLGAGSFACVPPGVVHAFSNPTDRPVRFLNFNTPAGWENYMRDLGQAAESGPLTAEVIGRVASRYDFHPA
jgi:mannose-6-phosphate isomerase-like protein (cupin superfamily)